MSVLTIFLLVLLVAGGVLIWEARTGRLTPVSRRGAVGRIVLFFSAAVVGAGLLMRTADSSLLLATALVPVTVLSLFRLVMVLRPRLRLPRLRGGLGLAVMAFALVLGVSATLTVLPKPLDQRVFIEKIFFNHSSPDSRSIDPAARRTARV